MRSLISVLLLGASGCSIATLSQASQPATSTNLSSQLTHDRLSTSTVEGQSKQLVSVTQKLMPGIDSYQWKNRLLLVFAPSKNNAEYQQQMQLWQGQEASFYERNLLTIELFTEGTSSVDAQETAKIRERFNVTSQEFRVVLVGKDGTAKRREQSPVSAQAIFETIDAMPMRQQEMRRSSN